MKIKKVEIMQYEPYINEEQIKQGLKDRACIKKYAYIRHDKDTYTKEDEENKDFDIYYQGKLVLHDYNHCGHYLYTAAVLFSRIKNKTADWVNLRNLWILRDCVRENYNHGIGVDDIIFGENFDGENLDRLTPLTKKRFDYLCKRIKELDPYATI